MGNTYINHAEHQGKLKEITQIGAELIGDNKSDADAEVIAMTIDSLLKCGLEEFQIEIGHVDYFHGLMEAAGLNEDEVNELMTLLSNKNFFGVEELITRCNVPENVKDIFNKLPELTGQIEVINTARSLFTNDLINNALDRMEKLYELLTMYGFEKYISFDLGIIANFDYYSGIIFHGYTYGTGNPIAKGGRYDNLLSQFGKNAPSIGFAIDLDQLLIVLNRQKININADSKKTLIIYDEDKKAQSIKEAILLRDHGIPTVSMRKSEQQTISEYEKYCYEYNFDTMIYITGDEVIRKEF